MRSTRCSASPRKALAMACASVLGSTAAPTAAQQETTAFPEMIRVEVTGSRIARADAETALPVQVIEREEILRGNWTTASELMAHVSANFNGMNPQLSIGNGRNAGLASANLRGLGDGNTLVLLNGRRLSNYAFLSGTVNLDTIPVAALERVEILKDGASSIYGTDAIAGVVNFITRKDFSGAEATAQAGITQQGGGDHYQATVTAGWGDLTRGRLSAFVTVDWQKDTGLAAAQRPYAATSYFPDEGRDGRTLTTIPANIRTGPGRFVNPGYAGGCMPPVSAPVPAIGPIDVPVCVSDPARFADIFPPTETWNVLARAAWEFMPGGQLFAEYVYARNQLELKFPPTPASRTNTIDSSPVLYPAGGPYYPTDFAAANGLSGPLDVFYRTFPLGPRVDEVTTEANRLVTGVQGTVGEWTYGGAYNHSVNTSQDAFTGGYVLASRLIPAIATGLINPFGDTGEAGFALLASTQLSGTVRTAKGTMDQFDVQASRELGALAGGPLALAVGGEWRRERLVDQPAPILDTGDILGSPFEISPQDASRRVSAAFAEVSIPFARSVEAGISVRYDQYSDFGGTTNPKVALRWQPMRSLLLRAAWGTGFRAPSLPELYYPQFTSTQGGLDDPVRCPVTESPEDCGFGEYRVVSVSCSPRPDPMDGRRIWEPVAAVSLGVQWWKIEKKNVILALGVDEILASYDTLGAARVIRGPPDPEFPTLPGPIQTIVATNENLGEVRTSGYDVTVKASATTGEFGRFQFALDGTYIQSFTEQLPGLPADATAGRYGVYGAVPRWRHYAQLHWQFGPWRATLGQTFQSGLVDAGPNPAGELRRVGSYSLWDLQGVYTGWRDTTIALGIRNLFDTDPPYTNSQFSGYDRAYADPHGRTFYARLTCSFK
jgi:iron complex outermembrane receptor protein